MFLVKHDISIEILYKLLICHVTINHVNRSKIMFLVKHDISIEILYKLLFFDEIVT